MPTDIWISPCPAAALGTGAISGMGMIDSPFYGDFGAILNMIPPATTIRLFNGIYGCRCDGTVALKDSHNLIGSGWGTILQRDNRAEWLANNQPVLRGRGDFIRVENLTLDAAGSDADQFQHSCLEIDGNNAYMNRVRGINSSGQWALDESWAFFFPTGEGSVVTDCVVSDVHGNYVEGFAFEKTGTIQRCHAEFPVLSSLDEPPYFNGFQAAGSSRILDCTQNGGRGFFATDTDSSLYLTISRCRGRNLIWPINVKVQSGQSCDGFTVDACTFELIPNLAGNRYGVAISGDGSIRNVRVLNSKFVYAAGIIDPTVPGLKFAAAVNGGIGTMYRNLMIDPDFTLQSENIDPAQGTAYAIRAAQAIP